MTYKDIPYGKPFYIRHPKQDITVWRTHLYEDGNVGLQIFFHEGYWRNPPTETHMEYDAVKAIEKYGVAYLPDNYVEEYEKQPWNKANEYRQLIAHEVLEARNAKENG